MTSLGFAARYALAALVGIYLAAVPFLYYRYRVHQAACPCHAVAKIN